MSGITGGAGSKSGIIGKTELQRFSKNYDRPGDGHYDIDGFTKFLLPSDTTDGSTTMVNTAGSHTITVSGVTHEDTKKKIGATSIFFERSNTDRLEISTANGADDMERGSADFTLDAWVYFVSKDDTGVIIAKNSSYWLSFGGSNLLGSANQFNFSLNGSGSWQIATSGAITVNTDQWYHVAGVVSGTKSFVFVNGIRSLSSEASIVSTVTGSELTIGGTDDGNRCFNGYIDEPRVSAGIARWTQNFRIY